MDAESVGMVSIAIGLLLVIGVVRGTWKKLLSDVGLGSGGSGTPAVNPNGNVARPQGKTLCYFSSSGTATCESSAADCANAGGELRPDVLGTCGPPVPETFPTAPTQDVWGGQNTVTYQV